MILTLFDHRAAHLSSTSTSSGLSAVTAVIALDSSPAHHTCSPRAETNYIYIYILYIYIFILHHFRICNPIWLSCDSTLLLSWVCDLFNVSTVAVPIFLFQRNDLSSFCNKSVLQPYDISSAEKGWEWQHMIETSNYDCDNCMQLIAVIIIYI